MGKGSKAKKTSPRHQSSKRGAGGNQASPTVRRPNQKSKTQDTMDTDPPSPQEAGEIREEEMEDVMTQVPEVHRVIASPPDLNTAPPQMENPPTATNPPLRQDKASPNSHQEVNKAKPDLSKDLVPTLELAKTPTTKDLPTGAGIRVRNFGLGES